MARLRFLSPFDPRDLPEAARTPSGEPSLLLDPDAAPGYRSKVAGTELVERATLLSDGVEIARFSGLDLPGTALADLRGAALARLMLRGDDKITGSKGCDRLMGFAGDDTLTGGAGADLMTGGGGADLFRFTRLSHSPADDPDRITDFHPGRDRIDLGGVDAVRGAPGDQAFDWIGGADFSGTAGELRWNGRALGADVDGDGAADFALRLDHAERPEADDFLL